MSEVQGQGVEKDPEPEGPDDWKCIYCHQTVKGDSTHHCSRR